MSEVKTNISEAIVEQIRPLQLSKASAEGHAEVLADMVRSGDVQALDMATRLRYIMNVCEQTLKQIQPESVAEVQSYNKFEKAIINGAKVEVSETGVKYDYESCNDPEWELASANETAMAIARKEREKFLKALPGPTTIVIESTGEMVTVNPPSKTSSKSVKITFEQ